MRVIVIRVGVKVTVMVRADETGAQNRGVVNTRKSLHTEYPDPRVYTQPWGAVDHDVLPSPSV